MKRALQHACSTLFSVLLVTLLTDLRQRDMLKDTLVIWGGEFGRTPHGQGSGRDHSNKGFSLWMAGGGIRSGMTYGATDDIGYETTQTNAQAFACLAMIRIQLRRLA